MSEDLTKKLSQSEEDPILTAIKNLDAHVGTIDGRLQGLEQRVGAVDGRLEGLEQKADEIEQHVGQLERKVDERLYDTRPIWHKVIDEINQLQAGQKRLEEGQQAMRAEMVEFNSIVRTVNRDQIIINDVVRRIQLDFHNFDERLHHFLLNRDRQNSST